VSEKPGLGSRIAGATLVAAPLYVYKMPHDRDIIGLQRINQQHGVMRFAFDQGSFREVLLTEGKLS
jgi:hypothetical protein